MVEHNGLRVSRSVFIFSLRSDYIEDVSPVVAAAQNHNNDVAPEGRKHDYTDITISVLICRTVLLWCGYYTEEGDNQLLGSCVRGQIHWRILSQLGTDKY